MISESTSMICSFCFREMPEVSAFCPACGRAVMAGGEELRASGHREALLGSLAYVTAVPAALLLLIPALKGSRFIRFHCWQSLFFLLATVVSGLALRLLFVIFSLLPWVGFLLAWLLLGVAMLAVVAVWAVLLTKAAQGETYELPVIGPLATRLAS